MNHSTAGRARPSLATMVAFLALFVAFGTSSHAGGLFTGKDLKNESITGKDLKNGSVTGKDLDSDSVTGTDVSGLTGDDIDESTLDTVTTARDSENAFLLDGLSSDDLLRVEGCQAGKLHGTARVLANGGGVPAVYTEQVAWIDSTYNCSGAAVQVRRDSSGLYFVKFLQNAARIALTEVRAGVGTTDICSTVDKVTTPGIDLNAFKVQLVDCGAGTVEDADFTLLAP